MTSLCECEKVKVSVCVITYNHGYWLRECLQSIVDQITCFRFEVIVGDDCSTDGISVNILREFSQKYPDLIVPLFRESNMGGHGTQNWFDVMSRASGDYIAHFDGDDRMLPEKLQKEADFLDLHPDCSMVAHDMRTFDALSGNTIADSFTTLRIPEISDINYLVLNGCFFGHGSKMFRRGAMMTTARKQSTVDFYLHLEHASKGHIGYIDMILSEYRKSTTSNTGADSTCSEQLSNGTFDAFDRALELGVDPNVVKRGRLRFSFSMACQSILSGNMVDFCNYIYLEKCNYKFATWKHILFYKLRLFPSVLSVITKGNSLFNMVLRRLL
jgi:glycosyltransferase involved in cell wall biosynthesis